MYYPCDLPGEMLLFAQQFLLSTESQHKENSWAPFLVSIQCGQSGKRCAEADVGEGEGEGAYLNRTEAEIMKIPSAL